MLDPKMFQGCGTAVVVAGIVCALLGALIWEGLKFLANHVHIGWT